MPCVGVEPVVPKPAVNLATKQVALSNVVPVQDVTCPAEVSESDAIDCNVRSGPAAAPECRVCEGANGVDVSGTKTTTEYSADQPAETLGVAGSSLFCSSTPYCTPLNNAPLIDAGWFWQN